MNALNLYVIRIIVVRPAYKKRKSTAYYQDPVYPQKFTPFYLVFVPLCSMYLSVKYEQVSRQSLKYRGSLLLNHLLKTKMLPSRRKRYFQ